MRLSLTRRNLGKLAAILGILQGISWAAMSLAVIILHHWSPNLDESTNYSKYLESLLYRHFIEGSESTSPIHIIRSSDFAIIMWIYFLLSIGWFAVSVDQFAAIWLEKRRQTTIMIIWGVITLIVSLIDLIFVSLLARDYAACNEESTIVDPDVSNVPLEVIECYLAVGIVMTVAARGYTLWVVNLVLAVLMFFGAADIIREQHGFGSLFSDFSIPRIMIPKRSHDRSFPEDTRTSFDFSRPNDNDQTLPRGGKFSPDFLSDEVPRPSFLSRGDKFTY